MLVSGAKLLFWAQQLCRAGDGSDSRLALTEKPGWVTKILERFWPYGWMLERLT
jgi:hypothetical protein